MAPESDTPESLGTFLCEGQAKQEAIVVHEDMLDAACQAASRSIDQLIWQGSAEVAKSVTLFGPGIVVLPLFGKVSGIDDKKCLTYSAHPKRVAKGGLMDRVDFESKFGQLDPARLVDELAGGRPGLDKRLLAMSNEELHDEVVALQDWREKANGRLKTLEKRAAWAFLGMPVGSANQASIKRAFKRKALELHPDKGGDAERFQLLQEMKELLIIPTPKELEEQEREAKEREAETEKARQKEEEKAKKQKETDKEAEEDDADFSGFSSDSSYDVDEEFKKMFPKRKKKKPKDDKEEAGDGDLDLGRGDNFNRDRHLAARRKLHRNFVDMWERAGKLAAEIKRANTNSGGEALRHLRKFIDRFANLEVTKLKENDPKKAERIFRRFLEQGSEILCAAGAVDPVATVSSVAMQVNRPLMSIAPSDDLQRRCTSLLEAIQSLPSIFDKHIMPAESILSGRRSAAKEEKPQRFTLLVPDPTNSSKRPDGLELPGVSEVEIELRGGSTLADLRAAALQMCPKDVFLGTTPRLFCEKCFISGHDTTPLTDIAVLGKGLPVQCLPSNKLFQPKARAKAMGGGAQVPVPQSPPCTAVDGSAVSRAAPAQPNSAAASVAVGTAPGTGTEDAAQSAGHADAKAVDPATHRPSAELLSKLGLKDAKASVAADSAPRAPQRKVHAEIDTKAEEDEHGHKAIAERQAAERRAEERRAREELERKAAEDEAGEEDSFFDDFFSSAKQAADARTKREREEEEERIKAERARREQQLEAEERKRAEVSMQRKAAAEQGKSAMEARLRAQKQAAEAKKKLERDKKQALEAKKKADAQQKTDGPGQNGTKHTKDMRMQDDIKVSTIVPAKEDAPVRALLRRRTSWDDTWTHPCAGERRSDGSAIFCYPCDSWINVGDPYDHRGFELHCEKVGHYGWID